MKIINRHSSKISNWSRPLRLEARRHSKYGDIVTAIRTCIIYRKMLRNILDSICLSVCRSVELHNLWKSSFPANWSLFLETSNDILHSAFVGLVLEHNLTLTCISLLKDFLTYYKLFVYCPFFSRVLISMLVNRNRFLYISHGSSHQNFSEKG